MADEEAPGGTAVADAPVEAAPSPAAPATGQYDYGDPSDGPPQIEHVGENKPAAEKSARGRSTTARTNGRAIPRANLPAAPKIEAKIADPEDDAAPSETAETPADPESTETAASTIEPSLMSQAEAYGYTKADAEELGEEALRKAITASDRIASKAFRESEAARQQNQNNGQAQNGQAPAKPSAPEPAAKTTSGFEKFKLELDPKEYDEGTIKTLNGLNDHYHDHIAKQAATIEELKGVIGRVAQNFDHVAGRFQAEDHARFSTDMDRFFEGLSDEFRPAFGKGPISELAPSSAEAKARVALVDEMRALQFTDAQRGRQTSVADLQQRALRLLHNDKLESVSRNALAKRVDARRNQTVARPTQRTQTAKTPDEAAKKFVENFMRDNGINYDDEAPDEL